MSTLSNIVSEPTGPIKVKFHMEPPWKRETKVCSIGTGLMTKMAAMPIYGKTLKKSSFPKGRWPWNLVCSIGCSITTKNVQMVTLGWPWPILRQGRIWSNLVPYASVWEKGKTMFFFLFFFSETIVVYDVKIGRCSRLNDYMNLYEYQRSGSFIDLGPRSLGFNIFKLLFLRNCLADWSKSL